jgi:hypothetical protein
VELKSETNHLYYCMVSVVQMSAMLGVGFIFGNRGTAANFSSENVTLSRCSKCGLPSRTIELK